MARRIKLKTDAYGHPFPALHPLSTVLLDVSAANRTAADAFSTAEIVRFVATEACYVKFGGSDVVATVNDVYLPAGIPEYFSLRGNEYISCLKTAAGAGTGKLHITIME